MLLTGPVAGLLDSWSAWSVFRQMEHNPAKRVRSLRLGGGLRLIPWTTDQTARRPFTAAPGCGPGCPRGPWTRSREPHSPGRRPRAFWLRRTSVWSAP